MRQTHSFEQAELSAKEFMAITGLERWQFTRRVDGKFTVSGNSAEAVAKLREAGYLAATNRWGELGESALYRIPEFDFSGLLEAFEAAAYLANFQQGGQMYSDPKTPDAFHEAVKLVGTPNVWDVEGTLYWVSSDPNLQYLFPLEVQQDPLVKLVDTQPGENLDIHYRLYDADGYVRVLDWTKQHYTDDGDSHLALLVETPMGLKVLTNQSLDTVVIARQSTVTPVMRSTIRLQVGTWSNWELVAEVFPEPERWSSISVRHDTPVNNRRFEMVKEAKTSVNWYSTTGDIECAEQFHAAYGIALDWAKKFTNVEVC